MAGEGESRREGDARGTADWGGLDGPEMWKLQDLLNVPKTAMRPGPRDLSSALWAWMAGKLTISA